MPKIFGLITLWRVYTGLIQLNQQLCRSIFGEDATEKLSIYVGYPVSIKLLLKQYFKVVSKMLLG
jgi:hypothetical protein